MAYAWDPSISGTTGATIMYHLMVALVAAGWTIPRASDGVTTYADGTNPITHAGTGAGGMDNVKAWFVARLGTKEWCFQRTSTAFGANSSTSWRVKYASAGFLAGGQTITVVPAGADEQVLLGGGTDASPTFTALFANDGTFKSHIITKTDAPKGFVLANYTNGTGAVTGGVAFDPMRAGSFADPDDADPYMCLVFANTASFGLASQMTSTSGNNKGWLKKGDAGAGFVGIQAMTYSVLPGSMGTNPENAKDDSLPIWYGREAAQAAPNGMKGMSTFSRWKCSARASQSTFTVSTSKDRIVLNDMVFPWGGSTPTV